MKPQILRDLRFLFSLVVACGPAGVPGAGGPGCGAGLLCGARPLCVPVGGGPPARSPHASLTARSGRSRGPPWPCRRPPAPRPGPAAHGRRSQAPPPPTGTAADPSGALHTGGAWLLMCYWVRCFEARPGLAPRSVPYPQFRMQFPDTCSSSLSEKPGISTITFQSMKCVRGIACEFLGQRAH